MSKALNSDDELLATIEAGRPFVDVRAPIEFAHGSIPHAVNLPLLDDDQRAEIGTVYKHRGLDSAVKRGEELISGEVRESRLRSWRQYLEKHREAKLYCFRGGLRSQSVRSALSEVGTDVDLIEGGYKRVRTLLLSEIERLAPLTEFAVISGRTGSGKTEVLKSLAKLRATCDFEGLANHKGSAFGSHRSSQPSQADFENRLALDLRRGRGRGPLVVEDESRMIGYNVVPDAVFKKFSESPLYIIEEPLETRAAFLAQSYIAENLELAEGASDLSLLKSSVLKSLDLIRRRLGGAEHAAIVLMVEDAVNDQAREGSVRVHVPWVARLLKSYYDPLYDHHLERSAARIRFCGSRAEVFERLSSLPTTDGPPSYPHSPS